MFMLTTKCKGSAADSVALASGEEAAALSQTRLTEMNDELTELLTKSEVLGEQGDVDGAQAAASQAEALRVMPRPWTSLWRICCVFFGCLDCSCVCVLAPQSTRNCAVEGTPTSARAVHTCMQP